MSDKKCYDDIAIHMLENYGIDLLDKEITDIIKVCAPALQAMQGEAASQPAVPDGYVLMEINCVPDFVLEAAMRDYRLVKQIGGDDRTLVLTAITAALLSAAKGE